MFEVLVYVYENYWRGDACPELTHLGRKLSAVGFEPDEIEQALQWLAGLSLVSTPMKAQPTQAAQSANAWVPSANSMRVYSVSEQDHLGAACLGFIEFLQASGVLTPVMREIVIDRAMAVPGRPVALDDLKIIVLMVFWSAGIEPDALVLDELCDTPERLAQ